MPILEHGAVNTTSVGDERGGERRRVSSPGGSRFICLNEAGVNVMGSGISFWEQ